MARRRRRQKLPKDPIICQIESLSPEGRGIARIDGKVTFIANALPGEEVSFTYHERHKDYDVGCMEQIIQPSDQRITPLCQHFEICGGCSLQQLSSDQQMAHKQQALLAQLAHIGKVTPMHVLPPLTELNTGYRRKARLGARYVTKKQRVLVGFRERYKPFIADIQQCQVLHPKIGYLLPQLNQLMAQLSIMQHIPQIEVAMGDQQTVLIIRHLAPFTATDICHLEQFEQQHRITFYLQPKGVDSIHSLTHDACLQYQLPAYDLTFNFSATDFTQVNSEINRRMVDQAMALLDPQANETILDLFCGIGNFTLPIARRAKSVVGVEGNEISVAKAKANAEYNSITNAAFYAEDLTQLNQVTSWSKQTVDKVLIDPPRTGALEVIQNFSTLLTQAKRIVYVSCYPATLARDAHELVHNYGYQLSHVGVMDMFPHTTHVESMALFVK